MANFEIETVLLSASDVLLKYPVLPAVLISAAWFYAGQKYLKEGNIVGAFLWQGIGILFLVALCVNIVITGRSWLNVVIGLMVIGAEIWILRSWWHRWRSNAHH